MNSFDKNSARAFRSMFGAFSRDIKRKYEAKANANREHSIPSSDPLQSRSAYRDGGLAPNGNVRDATPEENAIPAIRADAGNVVSLAGVAASKART